MTGAEVEPQSNGGDAAAAPAAADDTPSSLELDIIRQIEYYFGDINLPRDKFLQEQLKLDEGWVPLDVLTKFHRLAKLSTDTDVLANALAKATSGLMELSEDKKKVRRSPEHPLPELNEERRKELTSRTLYVKGFPLATTTVDDCLKFFQDYPVVENVIMRRYQDRATKKYMFKGSVFATFKTREQAEKFLNTEGVKIDDKEAVVKWQEDYLKGKHEEHQARKEQKSNKQQKKEQEKPVESNIKLPLGAVLHFTDIADTLSRETIKDALTEAGAEIAFVDFNKTDKEGWVRLTTENAAKPFFQKLTDGKLKVQDTELTFKVIEGDEEKAFLDRTVQEMLQRRQNNKNNSKGKFNKGGRHHGRNQGNRKRKQGPHSDAPAEKVKA